MKYITGVGALVLIAQTVFLLEHVQTDRQTDTQALLSVLSTPSATASMDCSRCGNKSVLLLCQIHTLASLAPHPADSRML